MNRWEVVFIVLDFLAYCFYFASRRTRYHLRDNSEKMLAEIARRVGFDHGYAAAKRGNPYNETPPGNILRDYYK